MRQFFGQGQADQLLSGVVHVMDIL
jgi:hypothetical protein